MSVAIGEAGEKRGGTRLTDDDKQLHVLNSFQQQQQNILLVGALSPVIHKGLNQGWTQTSLYLQVIHFTSHRTTSHVFLAYLFSAGTQHGKLHPAGWPILFCGPTQEQVLATANAGKKQERFWKKCTWMDWKGRNKKETPGNKLNMHGYILTYSKL